LKEKKSKDKKRDSTAPAYSKEQFVPLDKNSFEPLYFQIQSQLEQMICSGSLCVHDLLPGEAELSRIFGVSRMTSRQALQGLTSDGFAYRERGRGTFVCAAKVEKQIAHLLGFSAEMRLLGLKATAKVLAFATISATNQVAQALQIQAQSSVTMLHRLRLANGDPIAIPASTRLTSRERLCTKRSRRNSVSKSARRTRRLKPEEPPRKRPSCSE
jgi:GntR family transcriptional regulator